MSEKPRLFPTGVIIDGPQTFLEILAILLISIEYEFKF